MTREIEVLDMVAEIKQDKADAAEEADCFLRYAERLATGWHGNSGTS